MLVSDDAVVQSLQSCLTLCDLVYRSLPGSSVHGILQARLLECVALESSLPLTPPGNSLTMLLWWWLGYTNLGESEAENKSRTVLLLARGL